MALESYGCDGRTHSRVVPAKITATRLWELGGRGTELAIATEARHTFRLAAAAISVNHSQMSALSYATEDGSMVATVEEGMPSR